MNPYPIKSSGGGTFCRIRRDNFLLTSPSVTFSGVQGLISATDFSEPAPTNTTTSLFGINPISRSPWSPPSDGLFQYLQNITHTGDKSTFGHCTFNARTSNGGRNGGGRRSKHYYYNYYIILLNYSFRVSRRIRRPRARVSIPENLDC